MGSERCVLTLPLKTEIWQEDIINKRLEIMRIVYNAMLGYEQEKLRRLKADSEFIALTESLFYLINEDKKESMEYKAAIKRRGEMLQDYGFTEYQFRSEVAMFSSYFSENIGSMIANISIAGPMWTAFHTLLYGKGDMVHFKKKNSIHSVTSDGKSFLRVTDAAGKTLLQCSDTQDLFLTYGPVRRGGKPVILPIRYDKANDYEREMLSKPIKQVRILRKREKGRYHYYVQLNLEGKPAVKHTDDGVEKHPIGSGSVGLYFTTKTVTIASHKGVVKYPLSDKKNSNKARITELQQYLENSRRATNPDNYNEDGTIKNGILINGKRYPLTWTFSNRYQKAKAELAELYRQEYVRRQNHHQALANTILELGNDIRINDFSFMAAVKRSDKDIHLSDGTPVSKKRSGKSVLENAPALLIRMIEHRLLASDGKLTRIYLNDVPGYTESSGDTKAWAEYLKNL